MATAKIQTGLRLNETAYNKLRVLCARESRALNNLIEYVLQQYIEDYEAKNGVIQVPEAE